MGRVAFRNVGVRSKVSVPPWLAIMPLVIYSTVAFNQRPKQRVEICGRDGASMIAGGRATAGPERIVVKEDEQPGVGTHVHTRTDLAKIRAQILAI